MNEVKQLKLQLLTIAAIFAVPYIGAYINFNGAFPKDYFLFPHLSAVDKDCFSMPLFIFGSMLALGLAIFIVYPQILGFKKVVPKIPKVLTPKVSLPRWFWIGFLLWGSALTCFIFHLESPMLLVKWADIPLFWGFTLMIDGWVYVRSGGKSLIAQYPRSVVGIGVSAVLGWMIFEYLNNFVLESWYYPFAEIIPQDEFVIYAVIGSSGLIPPAIEIYSLLRTFPNLLTKYTQGPSISLPKWSLYLILAISLASLFLPPFFPQYMFPALWYAPLMLISVVLTFCGIWTPFTPVKTGDYSYVMLLSFSYVILGVCLEGFNYMSGTHALSDPDSCGVVRNMVEHTTNSSYWVYSIPFLNKYHIFEMPILGYLGYFPFGLYCAVWWILFASILGIKTDFKNNGC